MIANEWIVAGGIGLAICLALIAWKIREIIVTGRSARMETYLRLEKEAGMDKGQVEVLLGPAFTTSDDAQQMANWARRHWPLVRGRADEAWGYPFGWFFYFDKGKVVAITQYLEGAPYQ